MSVRLLVLVVLSVVLKLWLTSNIRILPIFAPHDDWNYVLHGFTVATGQWFGGYDQYTLIKQPFFPLYLAAIEQLGISLPVAHVLLDALASGIAVLAVRPLLRSFPAAAVLYVVLFFNPFTYDADAWRAQRSQVNPELALLAIACAYAIFLRRRDGLRAAVPWSVGLGVAWTAFWLTREEALWLVPALAVPLAVYALRRSGERMTFARRVVPCLIPIVVMAAGAAIVMAFNGRAYGWYTTNERQSREFVAAFNALARIDVPKIRFNQLPGRARAMAYAVSPAASELRAGFEGPNGANWHRMSAAPCGGDPSECGPTDVGDGFATWAFRDAVALAGHYTTGADARSYYVRLAAELDRACASGALRCRSTWSVLFPELADVNDIAHHFAEGIGSLLVLSSLSFDPLDPGTPAPGVRNGYAFVVRSIVDRGIDPAFPASWRLDVERDFGRTYRVLVPAGIVTAFGFLIVRLLRARRRARGRNAAYVVLWVTAVAGVVVLMGLLAAIDTLSFPAFAAEYLGGVVPLVLFATTLTLAVELPIALRVLRRRLPA